MNTGLAAKIGVPDVPDGVIQRERLFLSLDESSHKAIVWINSPAGSGKTTLIASYLAARKLPCLWYLVDAQDADPANFFYYMGLASQEKIAGLKKPLPFLTPEYLPAMKTFTRRYFDQLFESLHPPFTIVFDNYQDVSLHAPIHEIIADGLLSIPEGINILVLSRNEPPAILAQQARNDRFGYIGWNDLRFSFYEAKELAQRRMEKAINTESLSRLYERTDGWIAGLILIIERLKDSTIDYRLLEMLPFDDVFNFFATEIFSRGDAETQDFLMKTAYVAQITANIAEQLTGNRSAERILSNLARNHFFTEKDSHATSVYHYHPLFREFLLARAAKTFTHDEVKVILRKAAHLLEETGRVEDTAALFIEAADWTGLISFIIKQAPDMTLKGRYRVLLEWIAAVPSSLLDSSPWLLYWKGVCATPFDPSLAQLCLKKALNLFSDNADRTGTFMSLCSLQDVILHIGAFHLFNEWITLMGKALAVDGPFPSPDLEQRVIMNMISALTCSQPHHPDVTLWTDKGYALLDMSVDVPLPIRFCIAVHLNIYYLWIGNFSRATRAITLLRDTTRTANIPEIFGVWQKVQESLYRSFMTSPEDVIESVMTGLDFTAQCGIPMWDNHMILCGMLAAARSADWVTFNSLNSRLHIEKANFLDMAFNHMVLAIERYHNNDLASTHEHIKDGLKKYEDSGFKTSRMLFTSLHVELLLRKGDKAEALKWLSGMAEYAREIKSRLQEYICELFKAQIAFTDGDASRGLMSLRKAFSLGRENSYSRILWSIPYFLADLCMAALEHGIEIDYAKALISAHRLAHDAPPSHIETWPRPIRIYTLGRFELLKDDKLVMFYGKVQQKPLNLLKAMIAFGSRDIPDDRLVDALWPEAEGDAAKQSFDTTLYRLRKFLGDDEAITLQNGHVSLDSLRVWVDVWAFERLLCEAEDRWKKSGAGNMPDVTAVSLTEKALAFYKGHFLPSETKQAWSMSSRERLHMKFLSSVSALAGHWERADDCEKAVQTLRKGIEIDGLAEEFYQQLMICHHRLGQEAEVVKTFYRCRSVLSKSLGIEPSRRTKEIYSSIRQNG